MLIQYDVQDSACISALQRPFSTAQQRDQGHGTATQNIDVHTSMHALQ